MGQLSAQLSDPFVGLRQRVVATGLEFPEGPSYEASGAVFVAEMRGARVSRVDPAGGRVTHAAIAGSPGATAFGPDGAIYVTNNRARVFVDGRPRGSGERVPGGIDRIAPDGTVTALYRECDGAPLNAPNDLVFDRHGYIYFTDPDNGNLFEAGAQWPVGHIYRASVDGAKIVQVATGYQLCNGIAISDDGGQLFVCETLTCRIWVHDIHSDGTLSDRRLFGVLPEGHKPDGCCLDSEGNVICAAVGSGALIVFSADGELRARIPVEDEGVTNVAFGGDDHRTLFFTEGFLGRLSSFNWPWPGANPRPAVKAGSHDESEES